MILSLACHLEVYHDQQYLPGMGFEKKKRVINLELLREIKKWPCMACKSFGTSDPAHIMSRGAGGPDEEFNVIPLCRRCHTQQHTIGWAGFFNRWPILWYSLQTIGWYWLLDANGCDRKLWNDKLSCG